MEANNNADNHIYTMKQGKLRKRQLILFMDPWKQGFEEIIIKWTENALIYFSEQLVHCVTVSLTNVAFEWGVFIKVT